jgi:hypothetical protein
VSMPEDRGRGPGARGQSPESREKLTATGAWRIARVQLRLSSEEWLEMTPRMLHELAAERLTQMQREELLVGIIASTAANFGGSPPKKALTAASFMIHKFEKEEKPRRITGEYIMAQMAKLRK